MLLLAGAALIAAASELLSSPSFESVELNGLGFRALGAGVRSGPLGFSVVVIFVRVLAEGFRVLGLGLVGHSNDPSLRIIAAAHRFMAISTGLKCSRSRSPSPKAASTSLE